MKFIFKIVSRSLCKLNLICYVLVDFYRLDIKLRPIPIIILLTLIFILVFFFLYEVNLSKNEHMILINK